MQAKKNKGFLFLVYGLYLKKKKKNGRRSATGQHKSGKSFQMKYFAEASIVGYEPRASGKYGMSQIDS